VVGFRFAHDQSSLPALLDWAALTLVVQLFAACIAVVHARASRAGAPGAVPEVDAAGGPGTGGAPHA
jgi:hypothetical protein